MVRDGIARSTRLILDLETGGPRAAEALFPLLYDELRGIAQRLLSREGHGHTLQPTALVHEAWLRLADQSQVGTEDQVRFLRLAARAMRFVLVDHARARGADKRGGGKRPATLDEGLVGAVERAGDMLALHEGLEQLGQADPELVRLVELRFFGGLSHEQIAGNLGVSLRSVERSWRLARAFLTQHLAGDHAP
jgi:RNA polymerase sigma factor (TIGR02999 family)